MLWAFDEPLYSDELQERVLDVQAGRSRAIEIVDIGDETAVIQAEPVDEASRSILAPEDVISAISVEISNAHHLPVGAERRREIGGVVDEAAIAGGKPVEHQT